MSKFDSPESKNRLQWVGMASVAVVAAIAVWWLMNDSTEQAEPVSPPPEPQSISSTASTSQPAEPLFTPSDEPVVPAPSGAEEVLEITEEPPVPTNENTLTLENSDEMIRDTFSETQPNLLKLLTQEHMVRKFVRAVNALDDGELVNQYRPFVGPSRPFVAEQTGESEWQLSQENFERYTPYVNTLESLGAERLVALYRRHQPLIDEAFAELGTDKSGFESALVGALTQMLDTPEPSDTLALERPSVFYRYRDKELEKLPEAQKLLLRMGPENRQKIKKLVREIVALL